MNVGEQYRELLKERKKVDEVDYDNNPIIKKMIHLMTNNMEDTINYLKNDCSADEFIWLSELFREIIEKCPSQEFVDELYKLAEKYPEETKEYNIISFIDEIADYLND